MNSKIRALGIGTIALLLSLHAAAQLSCGKGPVAELACSDQEVRALIRQVGAESTRLNCGPAEQAELKTVLRSWGRRQHSCSKSTDIRPCVIEKIQSEIAYFKAMSRCEVASRPLTLEVAEPSYILAHPDVFKDKEVEVMGEIALASCDSDSNSVVGRLRELDHPSITLEIRFKSLPNTQREFLCSKRPFSSWKGLLRLTDKGTPYLYATDVLGMALP